MAYSVGIDLGTTYSAAATARGDRVEIFQLGERAATIPSIVVLRADGEVLTGDAAERRSLGEPTRTAREFKRRLGDPTPIILGGTPYGAEALLAHLLRAIVARVSTQLGSPPDSIVVTHPASYGAYKIDLLEQAIRQADIANVTLLTEPEAAAIHYAGQERVPAGAVIAVYDFGGGTFDATILRKTEDGFEQLGRPEGMERLGGIDFDEALFNRVMTQVRTSGATIDPNDPATLAAIARLREECRRAKEALSSDTDTTISVVPARSPDGDAPDARGIRGDDPAADHRDDRRARAGGQERRPRLRRRSTGSCSSAGRRVSRSWPRWSARRPAGRSRSTRIRSIRWRSGRRWSPRCVERRRRRTRRSSRRRARPRRRPCLRARRWRPATSLTTVPRAMRPAWLPGRRGCWRRRR